jgi:hypothetical protein
LANEAQGPRAPDPETLIERKLALLKRVLGLTQRQLLLVNVDELGGPLEEKDRLIEELRRLDRSLADSGRDPLAEPASAAARAEFARVIDAILANERAMEARMQEEQSRLRGELQALERQSRVKQYLEGSRPQGRKVDIKR